MTFCALLSFFLQYTIIVLVQFLLFNVLERAIFSRYARMNAILNPTSLQGSILSLEESDMQREFSLYVFYYFYERENEIVVNNSYLKNPEIFKHCNKCRSSWFRKQRELSKRQPM